ncbi:MAG: APC family permease [Pseudomonadales bacterium]|nr:APC family permease [Pseudomonadales bacterium]
MIGWSWVLFTGHWVLSAGSIGTLLAFAAGGVILVFIGLTYAELAAAMPKAGGEHVYTHAALGPVWSFICTWALLMAYATVCVFESVALPTAIEYLFPSIRLGTLWTVLDAPVSVGFVAIGIAAAVVMTWINVIGIRAAALVQGVITATVLGAGILLLLGAVNFGSLANTEPAIAIPATGILTVLIMVPAMMVGFDVLPQSAEEINLPPRRIGWLLVLSLLMAVLWYGGVSFAVSMALDPTALESSSMATADAATSLWNGRWAGTILIIGGVGGILTSWNAFIIGGSRVMFALSESGFLPPAFSRLHPRYKTPYIGVLVLGLMASISPFFGRTILVWLVDTGSFAVVVAYIFVPIAFLVLRRKEPDLDRPFRVRCPSLVGIIAIVLGLVLLSFYFPWSPSSLIWPYEWGIALGWALLGLVCWLFRGSRTN